MRFKKIWFFIFSLIIIWGCPSALLQAQETIQNDSIITVEMAFNDLYSARLESLFSLKSFLELSQNILDQEVDRLSEELGINHPKIKQMKASLEHNQSLIHDLEVELEIAEIEIPEVPQGGLLVHGRVTSANGRGIPGMRVYGENENRKRVLEFGTSQKTDSTGYFSILLEKSDLSEIADEKVFLVVKNTLTKEIIFRDSFPLDLSSETYILRNIVIK